MIDVEMSDDIRKYETKTLGMFTTRQLICAFVGLGYSLPIGLLIPTSASNKILIIGILMIPAILCGFVKMDGTHFEVFAMRFLYLYVLTPARRKMIRKNSYKESLDKQRAREEKIKLSKMPESKRKSYQRAKEHKMVKYTNKREYKVYK